jgi:uncharacterized cupredoxin-like copper-binding protein
VLASASQAPASAEPAATIRIQMREFSFAPSVITLPAGRPVRLMLVNRGQLAHQFETDYLRNLPVDLSSSTLRVEARGLDRVRLAPEESVLLEFLPGRRGRFTFACTIEGHREAGMHGVLDIR